MPTSLPVAGEASGDEAEADTLAALSLTSIPVTLIPAFSSISVVGCRPQYVPGHDAMLMTCQPRLTEPVTRRLKLLMDYTVAALLCVFLSPLFLVLAMAIRNDGGPVIYRHTRIGADGRSFRCLKFRSMRVNSDEILAELLESDPASAAEWASTRKLTNDPRVTPVGKLLRMTSLDELPQLWNVLRGEMSLVGPRPIVQAEVEFYGRWFGFYTHHEARPHRPVAGERPQHNELQPPRAAGRVVRAQLEPVAGHRHPADDHPRRPAPQRRNVNIRRLIQAGLCAARNIGLSLAAPRVNKAVSASRNSCPRALQVCNVVPACPCDAGWLLLDIAPR